MLLLLLFFICSISSTGCQGNIGKNVMNTPSEKCSEQLEKQLLELDYAAIFMHLGGDKLKLINQQYAIACFEQLVLDEKASSKARFFAAEILFAQNQAIILTFDKNKLAELYALALANNDTGIANPWGLPGEVDVVGQHLLTISQPTTEAWEALLDNKQKVLYVGSEEATVGNSYKYRVKDIAAFYVSKMRNLPYTVFNKPKERDTEIIRLKNSLELK